MHVLSIVVVVVVVLEALVLTDALGNSPAVDVARVEVGVNKDVLCQLYGAGSSGVGLGVVEDNARDVGLEGCLCFCKLFGSGVSIVVDCAGSAVVGSVLSSIVEHLIERHARVVDSKLLGELFSAGGVLLEVDCLLGNKYPLDIGIVSRASEFHHLASSCAASILCGCVGEIGVFGYYLNVVVAVVVLGEVPNEAFVLVVKVDVAVFA